MLTFFFSSAIEFINRTILMVDLHILDQWNNQKNDIRMSDDWWFWFISFSPIFNAFRLDKNFFSRLFFCCFLKNVKYEKSMYNKINTFIHVQGVPNLRVFYSTPDPNTPIFGLCTHKWGIFASIGDPLQSHLHKFYVTQVFFGPST